MTNPTVSASKTDHQLQPLRPVAAVFVVTLAAYWLAMFVATHIPIPKGVIPAGGGDKVLHLSGYALLGVLVLGVRAIRGPFRWWSVISRALILTLYAATDEFTQSFVGRQADFADWVADVIGAVSGLLAVVFIVRLRSFLNGR